MLGVYLWARLGYYSWQACRRLLEAKQRIAGYGTDATRRVSLILHDCAQGKDSKQEESKCNCSISRG